MATRGSGESAFTTASVDRLLDEFRSTDTAVEALFRVHREIVSAETLTADTAADAIQTLNEQVVLALDRGDGHTEYLYHRDDEDSTGWYSLTETRSRTVGPIALYDHNVDDRLDDGHRVEVVRADATPYSGVELAPHGRDAEADGVRVDG